MESGLNIQCMESGLYIHSVWNQDLFKHICINFRIYRLLDAHYIIMYYLAFLNWVLTMVHVIRCSIFVNILLKSCNILVISL